MGNSPAVDWRGLFMKKQTCEAIYCHLSLFLWKCWIHRSVMNDAGWFDEKFTAWGSEDNEWGYRVMNQGFWFIPILSAIGLHQEPPGGREFVDRKLVKITRMRIDMVLICIEHILGDCNSVPRIHLLNHITK